MHHGFNARPSHRRRCAQEPTGLAPVGCQRRVRSVRGLTTLGLELRVCGAADARGARAASATSAQSSPPGAREGHAQSTVMWEDELQRGLKRQGGPAACRAVTGRVGAGGARAWEASTPHLAVELSATW